MDIPSAWLSMTNAVRNQGNSGIAYITISAVDNAMRDLKAKLQDLPLIILSGMARNKMPVYGSGGFTSYSIDKLCNKLASWADQGMKWVKMKAGRRPQIDVQRVNAAREAIGQYTELMVDANGAYDVKKAVAKAHQFPKYGVTWFEEPVPSNNISGLRFIRENVPARMEVTAGEYGYHISDFNSFLESLENLTEFEIENKRGCYAKRQKLRGKGGSGNRSIGRSRPGNCSRVC